MHIKDDDIFYGELSARELVSQFGSPLYVYEQEIIEKQAYALHKAFKELPLEIYYACKANTNISILKLLKGLGIKVDCVSHGEILAAFKADYLPGEIVFTGNNVTCDDMRWAQEKGVQQVFDSVDQVQRFGQMFPGSNVAVRLNHMGAGHHHHVITGGPDSKFGIVRKDYDNLRRVLDQHNLALVGLHQHIGSGILNVDDWLKAIDVLIETLPEFPGVTWLDFGGGFGIPSAPEDSAIDLDALSEKMRERWQAVDLEKKLKLRIQPGRFLVAESGHLLMTVQSIKSTEKHLFAGTDSGLHHHIRHPLYQAYHPIFNATGASRKKVLTAVSGNICESADLFTHGREIAEVRVGDVLALGKAGAYGFVMASHYNSHPLPAEVLIKDGKPVLIRRRECYDRIFQEQEGLS